MSAKTENRAKALAEISRILSSKPEIVALADLHAADRPKFEATLNALEQLGASGRDVAKLRSAVVGELKGRRRLRAVQEGDTALPVRVREALPDAPVPDAAIVPPGWRVHDMGVVRETERKGEQGPYTELTSVALAPIVISARLTDHATGAEWLRVAWQRDGSFRERVVERATLADARLLAGLAAYGAPVNTNTTRHLVEFFAAFEAANLAVLPRLRVSSETGWIPDEAFLSGRRLIRAGGDETAEVSADAAAPEDWQEDWIAFRGDDDGNEQMADAYHERGTYEAWHEAATIAARYPAVAVALLASLAAPLLWLLRVASFIYDLSGETSRGKTSAARVAGSVWGCPDEDAEASTIHTWDATRVWFERAAAVTSDHPLIVDDTKRAKDPRVVAQTVYDLCGGRGRGRGSMKGMRRSTSHRTIAITTGEQKITAFTTGDGGPHARCLCAWGQPFGGANADTARIVSRLNAIVRENYGHAGPRFVRFLLANRDRWPEWRGLHATIRQLYSDSAPGDAVADRLAQYAAVLYVAGRIAGEALDLPNLERSVDALWPQFASEGASADRASVALADVMAWATSEATRFYERADWIRDRDGEPVRRIKPVSGWLGRWPREDWEWIAIFPDRLRKYLAGEGYEVDAILRTWKDRGWLETSTDHARIAKKMKFPEDNQTTWMVVIRREAFNAKFPTNGDRGNQGGTKETQEDEYFKESSSPGSPSSHPFDSQTREALTTLEPRSIEMSFIEHPSVVPNNRGNLGNLGNLLGREQLTDTLWGNQGGTKGTSGGNSRRSSSRYALPGSIRCSHCGVSALPKDAKPGNCSVCGGHTCYSCRVEEDEERADGLCRVCAEKAVEVHQ